ADVVDALIIEPHIIDNICPDNRRQPKLNVVVVVFVDSPVRGQPVGSDWGESIVIVQAVTDKHIMLVVELDVASHIQQEPVIRRLERRCELIEDWGSGVEERKNRTLV